MGGLLMRENLSLRLERASMSTFQGLIQSSFINVLPDQSLEANMPRWCYDFRGIEFALEKMKKKEVAQVRAVCSNLSIQKTAPASREQSQHFPHPIIDLHSLSKYLLTMYETGENTLARAFCQLQYFFKKSFCPETLISCRSPWSLPMDLVQPDVPNWYQKHSLFLLNSSTCNYL